MGHAITLGGLLSGLAIVVGLAALGIGGLMIFAGGMSDAPEAGASASSTGCLVATVGIILLIGGIVGIA